MAQLFTPAATTIFRVSLGALVIGLTGFIGLLMAVDRSDYNTKVAEAREQPVMFSHKHHVGGLGIHCAYCHSSVAESAFAGIPPTHTCMSCHSQIWTNSSMLEPVRQSYRTGESIQWTRIHDLPEFVFFNHSIHIHKGIGCTTCHGNIAGMNLTFKAASLQMEWCLNCHRQPERYVRPRASVYDPHYKPPPDQLQLGAKLVAEYKIQKLLDCYTCHR